MTAARWSVPAVAALSALAFLPALGADFVNWDDEISFLRNRDYRGLGLAQLRWIFTTTLLGHWSPLTWLTWSANFVAGGMQPFGYHLLSVVIHAVNVGLFALVSRRLLAQAFRLPASSSAIVAGAVFAALAFGVHPLRAEAVAWISGRRDVLCATFYLASVLAYLRGVSADRTIERRWWIMSLAAFAAALGAKASAFTLPLTLLLLDLYPLGRRSLGWRALIVEKVPYGMLAAGAAIMAFLARHEGGNITEYGRYGLDSRIALSAYTFAFYPWKSLWPTGLAAGYELPYTIRLSEPRFALALATVVVVTVGLLALRRRWPAGLTAWLAFVIVLVPISGAVHSGEQLAADRYSYLSCFSLAVLSGAAVVWAIRRDFVVPTVAIGAVLVTALGVATWKQTATWHDSESLWRRAVQIDPACSLCWSNLGRVIARPGRFEEAQSHVARAMALRPDRPGPHENMGVIMLALGRLPEAEARFREVVKIRPHHGPSRNNFGAILAHTGRDAEAEAEFREAARLSPRLVDAPANLGALYLRQRRFDEAVVVLTQALALDPARPSTRRDLDVALAARTTRR
jgi:Flp pilus assembly protein TadD